VVNKKKKKKKKEKKEKHTPKIKHLSQNKKQFIHETKACLLWFTTKFVVHLFQRCKKL